MSTKKLIIFLIFVGGIAGVYFLVDHRPKLNPIYSSSLLNLSSPAFVNDGIIPDRYTCFGENISPPMVFSGVPGDTGSLILIMDDPDATERPFTHWIVYDIPPTSKGLNDGDLSVGTVSRNSNGDDKYTGPCPTDGEHTYHFTLYAYDSIFSESIRTKAQLINSGHVLDKTELLGRFGKVR